MKAKQFIVTASMGKRIVAKGAVLHPDLRDVLRKGTLVIVAGSTNGYVAEEILQSIGQAEGFSRAGFRRGTVVPPGFAGLKKADLKGDVVITDGKWREGDRDKTVFDVAGSLKAGDVVLKGGNAVNLASGQAAVYIGDPSSGTAGAILPVVYGRRVKLIVPIGLEKRVTDDIDTLASDINDTGTEGPRFMPLPGGILTELEAIKLLTGCKARLAAGGGIYGAEGSVWLVVKGSDGELAAAEKLLDSVSQEPPCEV